MATGIPEGYHSVQPYLMFRSTHGARMGGVRDPFGYTWWIATQQRDLTREELERTA